MLIGVFFGVLNYYWKIRSVHSWHISTHVQPKLAGDAPFVLYHSRLNGASYPVMPSILAIIRRWYRYFTIDVMLAHITTIFPVSAQEHCRISLPRSLAECHKRQLKRASFVLFAFSGLNLVCLSSVFLICLLSCIFQREPTWMALCSLTVLMCR